LCDFWDGDFWDVRENLQAFVDFLVRPKNPPY